MAREYINGTSFAERPEGNSSDFFGKIETYTFNTPLHMLMICPHCGTEIVARWKGYRVSIRSKDFYNDDHKAAEKQAKERLERKYNYSKTWKAITDEIGSLLDPEKFRCISCGKPLSYEAGYYYNGCYERAFYANSEIDDVIRNRKWYTRNGAFLYPNSESLLKYTQLKNGIDDAGKDGNISDFAYCHNALAMEYCKTHNIKEKESYHSCMYVFAHDEAQEKWVKDYLSEDESFDLMRFYREKLSEEERTEHVHQIIETETSLAESSVSNPSQKNTPLTPEALKLYLYNLIQIETDILALTRRLRDLYFLQREYSCKKNQFLNTKKELLALEEAKLAHADAVRFRDGIKGNDDYWQQFYPAILSAKGQESLPEEPPKPGEPVLEKPGLFNKRKVTAENERKMTAYQAALAAWESDVRHWSEETERITQLNQVKKEAAEAEAKEKARREAESAEDSVKKSQFAISEAQKELDQKQQSIDQFAEDDIWTREVQNTESLLKKSVDARIQFEQLNIIFPKYRDLVAYTSFYEYLETGRCSALAGSDGAYNLYETELRQNTVIAKLSSILESMEEIKKNQYMIYSQLSKMNASIDRLNSSMDKAVASLDVIGDGVSSIQDYTRRVAENSDVIAYNTAAAAYYTKLNADLTNSLGYLVAFK